MMQVASSSAVRLGARAGRARSPASASQLSTRRFASDRRYLLQAQVSTSSEARRHLSAYTRPSMHPSIRCALLAPSSTRAASTRSSPASSTSPSSPASSSSDIPPPDVPESVKSSRIRKAEGANARIRRPTTAAAGKAAEAAQPASSGEAAQENVATATEQSAQSTEAGSAFSRTAETSLPAEAKAAAGAVAAAAAPSLRSRLSSIWKTAKQLFKFYFQGLKQILRNRTEVKRIQQLVRNEGYEMTRADRQLARTHRADMLKLPLFVAILVILEEILPVVVIYAPSLLPSTCILPSQLDSIHSSAELKKHQMMQDLLGKVETSPAGSEEAAKEGADKSSAAEVEAVLEAVRAEGTVTHAGALQQLSRPTLVKLATLYNLGTFLAPAGILRSRIASHLAYLRGDDLLMSEGRGFNSIPQDKAGLLKASSERGLRAVGVPHAQQVAALEAWVARSTATDDPRGSHLLLAPLELYTAEGIAQLQALAEIERQKGVVKRTMELMNSVVKAEEVEQERNKRREEEIQAKALEEAKDQPPHASKEEEEKKKL